MNATCVRPGDTLEEAAHKMKDPDAGSMLVCDDNAIRAVAERKDPKAAEVQDAMSECGVVPPSPHRPHHATERFLLLRRLRERLPDARWPERPR